MQQLKPGVVLNGYVFQGGNPADPNSWQLPKLVPGAEMNGFVFSGGNPDDEKSWLKKDASRGAFGLINDNVIEVANAAAGGVKAVSDFISPGNRVSKAIDGLIKSGEESQSDQTKASKLQFQNKLANAIDAGEEIGAVLDYIADSPLLAVSQAVGSFALPGGAVKGAGLIARALGGGQKATQLAGRAGGVAVGAAMGGGDAAGSAYDAVMSTPTEVISAAPEFSQLLESGKSEDEARQELATKAARKASVLPALVGGAFGAVGLEKLLAGGGGYTGGVAARAFKGFASEGAQEGFEEGLTQFEGNRAASQYNPQIDPLKGVAGAATFGGLIGGAMGGGVSAFTPSVDLVGKATTADEAIEAAIAAQDIGIVVQPKTSYTPAEGNQDASARIESAAQSFVPDIDPVQQRLEMASASGAKLADNPINRKIGEIQQAIAARGGMATPNEASFLERYGAGKPYDRVAAPEELGAPAARAKIEMPVSDSIFVDGVSNSRGAVKVGVEPSAFQYDQVAQGRKRAEPAPASRVDTFIEQQRNTNTPAAQLLVRQFDSGALSEAQVNDILKARNDSKNARFLAPDPVQNRLTSAAEQGVRPQNMSSENRILVETSRRKTPAIKQPEKTRSQDFDAAQEISQRLESAAASQVKENSLPEISGRRFNNPIEKRIVEITEAIAARGGVPTEKETNFLKNYGASIPTQSVDVRSQADEFIDSQRKINTPAAKMLVRQYDSGSLRADDLKPLIERFALENKSPLMRIQDAASQTGAGNEILIERPSSSKPVAKGWESFAPETGTLNVPRAEMPQVKAENRGAMVNFLNARGVAHQQEEVSAGSLKPTQAEFSREKVEKAKQFEGGDRSILVSADGYVVDGHHQWLAKKEKGEPVKAIRLKAPIADLLPLVKEFPSSTVDESSATGVAGVANMLVADEVPAQAPQANLRSMDAPQEFAQVQPALTARQVQEQAEIQRQLDKKAIRSAERLANKPAAVFSVGMMPNSADPITVRGGVVYIGDEPAQDFETGDDVIVADSASPVQIRDALKASGAVANKVRFFGIPNEAAQQNTAKKGRAFNALPDASSDSMFAAIAKLGGISKSQIEGEWGVDPASIKNLFGAGIKRVATSKGRSIDAMAEALADMGYISKDENGRYDINELEDLFRGELGGSKNYAPEGFEAKAEAQKQQAYEDYLSEQDAIESGYNELPEEAQDSIDRELSRYEDITEDEESRIEREAIQWESGSGRGMEADDADIPFDTISTERGNEGFAEFDTQAQGEQGVNEFGLTGQTSDDIRAQEEQRQEAQRQQREAENRAQADAEVDDFRLTGSNRAVDRAEAAGQGNIFDLPADVVPQKELGRTVIEDLGEKIGGARKDLAGSSPRSSGGKTKDNRPTWARRFEVSEIIAGDGIGRWTIRDTRKIDWLGQSRQVGGSQNTFATEQEALDAIPLAAVSMKHRAVPTGAMSKDGEYTYEIWRDINDRKRVKVVNQVFPSRVAAMEYMAKNAQSILETSTTFGEADLPTPDRTSRTGVARRTGDVEGSDFMKSFGLRAVEFGNWNNQIERQEVMNAAYDGLMDLAEVVGIPPKAIGLNGDLALAFGARGQGLSSARAHYERERAVINLTKMNGAGALAHEWFHALDHYFGRQDGKAFSQWRVEEDGTRTFKIKGAESDMASGGFSRVNSGVRQELRDAYKNVMETMFNKAEQYVEDTVKADQFVAKSREDVAERLDSLRKELSEQKDVRYYKRNNKPASAEQLAEFDTVAKKIIDGDALDVEYIQISGSRTATGSRWSNEALEKLNAIYKAVRGRSGFDDKNQGGIMDRLRGEMNRYGQRLKMLADAQSGEQKTKRVPTEFAMDAKELDQGRGENYWTTPHEMAARAFQGYVEDKIAAQGASSPFLNYAPENFGILTPWGAKRPYPYGKEREAINNALDAFVEVLETRETDSGVAMFSRRTGFADKVDMVLDGTLPESTAIGVARSVPVLTALGMPDLPLATTGDRIAKMHFDHGMTRAEIASLEQEIQNPVMVFESDSIPGAKVLVTGMWRDGAPVVAAIRPNVELKRFDVNLLASAYGKDRIEQLGKWNDAGLLRYFDKQKALAWATIGGVQFPWMVQLQQRLPINVIGPADVVKPSFKRGADGSAGVAELQEFADSLTAGWANAPEVVVLNSLDDANTPQAVLRENEAQKSKGANGKPRAFFYDGKVWLVNSQLNDKADAAEALFHEALGHYGLRGVFGKALGPVLNDLANRRPELMQAKAKEYGLNLGTVEGKLTAAEEVLAELAQTKPEISFIRMAVAAVRTWLRNNVEFFNNLKLTDDEIVRNFIVPARNWVETGKSKKPTIYRDDNQDVNNQDVRFSRGTDKERASFKVEESGKLDNIIYKLQDKNVDLKRVSQAITKQTGELEDTINAYQKESLYHGKAAKQSKDFLDKQLKPLLDEMRARKVNLQEFENYLWNRHAPERNDQIAKVNDRFPDGGSGIKTEDAMRYLKGLPEDKRRHFEALAKRVDQITRDNMQMMVDSGLEKQETIDSMKGAYKHYVPLLRGESSSYDGKGQGYSIRGATTKRALGSDKPVENIISALADQREKIISRSQKAEVGRALMGLALENPQDDFWFVFDPLLNKDEGQRTRLRDQLETMGLDSDLADEISRQPYTEEMGKSGKVIRTPNKRLTELPTALAVRINGEDKYIVFNKDNDRARRMGESLSNLDAPKLDGVLGFVGPITRYFASINTQYNPIFGIVNLVRDVQGALFNLTSTKIAGKQAEVMKGIYPATKGIYQAVRASRTGGIASGEWADLYERFQNVGGQTGFRDMFSTPKERTEKQLKEVLDPSNFQKMYSKSAKWLFDGLSDYNEMLENGVRLSAFKAALDSGLSDEQAASLAKELTVNFNRKGQVGSQMSAGYAFFNASTQGSARLIETLKGPKGKRIITGGILLGVVQTMALAMAGFDDEDPKEFVRERNLIIPTGGGDYLTIPMPLGLHVLPNIGRIITEQLMGRTRKKPIESFASLFGVMVDSFNPMGSGTVLQTAMPTIADPIVALIENKDFTGSNIAREDFNPNKPTPGYTRTKANSIDSLVIVARALNFLTGGSDYTQGLISPTPDQLEYLISQVTGGVGREVSKFVQLGETAISGEELPPYKVPLLGRFYGNTTSQSSQAGQFYENLRAMNDHKLEIKGRLEDGLSTSDYIKDNPEAKIFRQAEAVERRVQELGRTKRKLKDNGAGPESIKQVEESITRVMTGFNEQVKRLRAVKEG